MKIVAPAYYQRFACIKGACRHSCCKGWEIDIDADTLQKYQAVPGEMGERLRAGIDRENGCFILAQDERCPFLNQEGLCDIILQLGEDHLCQICDDHPRFRNFFTDRIEIGLGMCCEAAARLILTEQEPMRLVTLEDDGAQEPENEYEAQLLKLRPVLTEGTPLNMDISCWVPFMLTLERLDETWADRLRELENLPSHRHSEQTKWHAPLLRLYEYLMYRHMPGALEDGTMQGHAQLAGLMWQIIREMFDRLEEPSMDALIELCRLYSSEIEYSDENVQAILQEIRRQDKWRTTIG